MWQGQSPGSACGRHRRLFCWPVQSWPLCEAARSGVVDGSCAAGVFFCISFIFLFLTWLTRSLLLQPQHPMNREAGARSYPFPSLFQPFFCFCVQGMFFTSSTSYSRHFPTIPVTSLHNSEQNRTKVRSMWHTLNWEAVAGYEHFLPRCLLVVMVHVCCVLDRMRLV